MLPLNIFVFITGLSIGSFIGAISYRVPRCISIWKKSRSFCPKCGATIAWYDNIPLFSYLVLAGKCRKCRKKISPRYPLIELFTGFVFLLMYLTINSCSSILVGEEVCSWTSVLGLWSYPLLLLLSSALVFILVVDIENMVIYDFLVFVIFTTTVILLLLFRMDVFYVHVFSGFLVALILLVLNLVTKGRGMGLGDAKLALAGGVMLGFPGSLYWLFVGFVLGAISGVIMILLKRATLGKQIPFGPFLVISFFIVLIYGNFLGSLIYY